MLLILEVFFIFGINGLTMGQFSGGSFGRSSGGLFGSTSGSGGLFGTPTTTQGLFGSGNSQTFRTGSSGGFSSSGGAFSGGRAVAASIGFGAGTQSSSGGSFGLSSGGLFGSTSGSGGLFGTPTSTSGGFGLSSTFTPGSLFGHSSSSTGGLFEQPATSSCGGHHLVVQAWDLEHLVPRLDLENQPSDRVLDLVQPLAQGLFESGNSQTFGTVSSGGFSSSGGAFSGGGAGVAATGLGAGTQYSSGATWLFPETAVRIKNQLKVDEDYVTEIYRDPLGFPSFGVGHLIKSTDPESKLKVHTKVSKERVDSVFEQDFIEHAALTKEIFPKCSTWPIEVQEVMVNMAFNLGGKLRGFKKLAQALDERDWKKAADEMENSKWYGQVGDRSKRLVDRMRRVEEF